MVSALFVAKTNSVRFICKKQYRKSSKNMNWRLQKAGINKITQLPLLLPRQFKNYMQPIIASNVFVEQSRMFCATLCGEPIYDNSKKLLKFEFKDYKGRIVYASSFGNSYHLYQKLKDYRQITPNEPIFIYGKLTKFNQWFQLKDVELVSSEMKGKIIPIYPSTKNVITSETLIKHISEYLLLEDNIKATYEEAKNSNQYFSTIIPYLTFRKLLHDIHLPIDIEVAKKSLNELKKSAMKLALLSGRPKTVANATVRIFINKQDLNTITRELPFELSTEQEQIVNSIIEKINDGKKLNELISGDVGTGKTVCYLIPALMLLRTGHNVSIILPTEVLAKQIYDKFVELSDIDSIFYGSNIDKNIDNINSAKGRILIGTCGVLNRESSFEKRTDLWVIDEEHKFGTEIKENYYINSSNYIGSTATCIPRTQQLLSLNEYEVHRLTKCHVEKNIVTTIFDSNDASLLFSNIKKTIVKNKKTIVIYPIAQISEYNENLPARYNSEVTSVESAYPIWQKAFPNTSVSMLYGSMKEGDKYNQISTFKNQRGSILISTTAIEVGFDDPDVERVVIVHPEVHGLAGLHQLRGRAGRNGGDAYCDLFLPSEVKDKTSQRLKTFLLINDGFELSEMDLKARGFGNLAKTGKEQSGDIASFLVNHKFKIDDFTA
jgi:ATP-dependent DNA helicase RecG